MNVNKEAEHWANQKLYVTNCHNSKKLGIFASRMIKKGEVIFVFKGVEIRTEYNQYWEGEEWWIQIGHKKWLDPEGYGKFLNHSCNPNSFVSKSVVLVAFRDIHPLEEVTIDYDTTDWTFSAYDPFACKCGSENCRKVIEGYKSLPNNIREAYKRIGLIPEYLLEMEKRENGIAEDK